MTEQKIIDKLSKLHKHMESAEKIGSEAEAQAFAEKIQKLLSDHKLSMSDVEYANIEAEDPVKVRSLAEDEIEDAGITIRNRRIPWLERLADGVAYGHFCQYLVHNGSSRISFVGRGTDSTIASYMFLILQRTAEDLADKEYAIRWKECADRGDVTLARGFRKAFLMGFATRIRFRYFSERNETEKKVEESSNTQAIIRLNSSDIAIRKFLEARKIRKTYNVGDNMLLNAEGYKRGQKAGDIAELASSQQKRLN